MCKRRSPNKVPAEKATIMLKNFLEIVFVCWNVIEIKHKSKKTGILGNDKRIIPMIAFI